MHFNIREKRSHAHYVFCHLVKWLKWLVFIYHKLEEQGYGDQKIVSESYFTRKLLQFFSFQEMIFIFVQSVFFK